MSVLIGILTVIHVLVALFLIVLVLMQKSKDQGVGAAFGGGMTETVFGAGTTTALLKMTIWCACIMLGTTLLLAILHTRRGGTGSLMEKAVQSAPALPIPAPSQPTALPAAAPSQPTTLSAPAPSQPTALPTALPEEPASEPAKTP